MSDVAADVEAVLPSSLAVAAAPAPAAPDTEAQFALLRRCQRREPGAFEDLVRRFQPRVFSVLRGILRQSHDVDDVAQQVFTKVYFALDQFNFQSAVGTWIYKIAVNECYDHIRKLKVRKTTILADLSAEEAARVENRDRAVEAGQLPLDRQLELRDYTHKLLARISPENRVLLVLKEVEGYSVKEVAEILGLNENTIKVRLFRARQALVGAVKRKRV